MLRLALGADPDTRTPAFALLEAHVTGARPTVIEVGIARVKGSSVDERLSALPIAVSVALRKLLWSGEWRIPHMAAVEWQRIRPFADPRPNDILNLCSVGGMVAGSLAQIAGMQSMGCETLLPQPSMWKGTIPKGVHQARVRARMSLLCPCGSGVIEQELVPGNPVVVKGSEDLTSTERGHVLDAIGLAWWALERHGWVRR